MFYCTFETEKGMKLVSIKLETLVDEELIIKQLFHYFGTSVTELVYKQRKTRYSRLVTCKASQQRWLTTVNVGH